ncbi:MAG TPA: glutathione S-transferase family protein [Rhizomicrobium sp.]
MITIWGEGRGLRVVWLLEEMGLQYNLRPVDLLKGAESDPEFMAVNPGGFIPAMRDGDVTMVESIAIMEYLMAKYGPTPLAPAVSDPSFPGYQQFLHLGEAGLATAVYYVLGARRIAPPDQRDNWTANQALRGFETRMRLVARQLERAPYMAGEAFTAADVSVCYALLLSKRAGGITLDSAVRDYLARATSRDAYKRALDTCQATRDSQPEE